MIQIDVPIAIGIGSLFADAAHKQLQTRRADYYFRIFAANNIFHMLFFVWIPVYFLTNYFGWETTHMWWHADSIDAYAYYLPVFLIVFFGAANLGFLLGQRLVCLGRLWTNRGIYLGILVYSSIWIVGQVDRSLRIGTYNDWITGRAPWFWEDHTFLGMLVLSVVMWVAALLLFVLRLRTEGRSLDVPTAAR